MVLWFIATLHSVFMIASFIIASFIIAYLQAFKILQAFRSSEEENPLWSGVEQCIISAMYGSPFFLSRLLMIFMALSTSLLFQKIVWVACCVGETIFGCKLLVFKGWIWGSIVGYNFLKHLCLAKIDFVRDYLRRLPIQFTYLNIPGVMINNK